MFRTSRRWLWASRFACSVALLCSASATSSKAARQNTNPADDTALRVLAAEFYTAYAKADLEALLKLWNAKAPDLPAFKQRAQQQFTALKQLAANHMNVHTVTVRGERAKLQLELDLAALDAKTGQPALGLGRMQRVLEGVKEAGVWRVWRELSATEDFANTLLATQAATERTALRAQHSALVNTALVSVLGEEGERLRQQGNNAQAVRYTELALEVNQQVGDQDAEANWLSTLGVALQGLGNYVGSLEPLTRGLKLREAQQNQAGIASAYNNLAIAHRNLGNPSLAVTYYLQSLRLRYELGDKANKRGLAATLANAGAAYHDLGDYAQALEHYQRAIPIHETANDQTGLAVTLNNIGNLYSYQRNTPLALEYLRKSLALSQAVGHQPNAILALQNIGLALRGAGRYDEALATLQQSLALSEQHKLQREIITTLNGIGFTQRLKGDYAAAEAALQRALPLAEASGIKRDLLNLLNNFSALYEAQQQSVPMLAFAQRAAELARQSNNRHALAQALTRSGKAQLALQQPAQAQAAFTEAIAEIESLRTQVAGSPEERQRFFEDKIAPYHQLLRLALVQNQNAEALHLAERVKARTLFDLLAREQTSINKALTPTEQTQERDANALLAQLNGLLTRESQRPQPDQARVADLKNKLQQARLDHEAFTNNLYAAHPELKTQRGEAQLIQADEALRLLPNAATALLAYTVTAEQTLLFVLTKTAGLRVHTLPITAQDLTARVTAFRQQLAQRDPAFADAARGLYDLLLKPAAPQLAGKTQLAIVPDGALWELPFQALQAAPNRFLIQTSALSYAPSLTVLREMSKPRRVTQPSGRTLLAFGNPTLGPQTVTRAKTVLMDEQFGPLKYAEEQVSQLAALYGPRQSKVYLGAEAREDRAKAEAAHHRILHLATHGVLNDASPLYSHVLLAQPTALGNAAQEDGLLEARELMKLDLKADLVVLSACETARGRVGAGEGVIGLTWALFVAGCPRTVVSQWKVEEVSTSDLMVAFHRALKPQLNRAKAELQPARALQTAALKLLRGGQYRHPFYWAGFVVVGAGY